MIHYVGDWTIEVPADFTLCEPLDCFVVFERPGMRICATVHAGFPWNSEAAIALWREQVEDAGDQRVPFDVTAPGLTACGLFDDRFGELHFVGGVSANGQVANARFTFTDRRDLDTVLSVCRSLKPVPDELAVFPRDPPDG